MSDENNVTDSTLYQDLGVLSEQTKAVKEEIEHCEVKEEAVVGFLAVVGKAIMKIFGVSL